MCGICGIIHRDLERPVDQASLLAMRDSLIHRGPDDQGAFFAPGVGLGSRRLSILDLSERGRMPMNTSDGRYWIVHNGEVYNYRELRLELQAHGLHFRSDTDTEVLLNLYAREGPAMLERLNGMFAFAIWDSQERTLFLARDRLGIKPLYYALHEAGLSFASEAKALFAAGCPASFDPDTLTELLLFRFTAGEVTPFQGVKRLLPGHYLLYRSGDLSIKTWWSLASRVQELRAASVGDPAAWFSATFDDAVRLRRISDVPLGVLLSGGLDSSTVAASLALQTGECIASFTVRFAEAGYDEGPYARAVASRWRLDYHELFLDGETLLDGLQNATFLNDEPLVHGNDLHLHAIARFAKSRVTVLLSGEGADETLGGYVRYRPLRYPGLLDVLRLLNRRANRLFPADGRLGKLARFLSLGSTEQFVLYNACNVLPFELDALGFTEAGGFAYREQVLQHARQLYPGDHIRQAMFLDQHTFLSSILDRNDRMTMGASIECRVPFLDHRLVEGLASLSASSLLNGSTGKPLLRKSLGGRLPRSVLAHRKWGFGVPWGSQLREVPALRDLVSALPGSEPFSSGLVNVGELSRVVNGFLQGDDRHLALVQQMIMIVLWHRAFIT